MRLKLALVALLVTALVGCESLFPKCGQGSNCAPVEPNYPTDLEGPALAQAATDACANFRMIDCPEGDAPNCEDVIIARAHRGPTPVKCWANAKDSVSAKVCGSLRCIHPR